MRERIKEAVGRFRFEHSIELPDKTTEIDILLADEASSTLVFAELKWSRNRDGKRQREFQVRGD